MEIKIVEFEDEFGWPKAAIIVSIAQRMVTLIGKPNEKSVQPRGCYITDLSGKLHVSSSDYSEILKRWRDE